MSKAERIKEQLGWLKVMFVALIAIDVSLIAWLAQNYQGADVVLLGLAVIAIAGVTAGIIAESLGLSPHGAIGGGVMVWFVVAGVTIFVGGMLIVVAEAARHSRD